VSLTRILEKGQRLTIDRMRGNRGNITTIEGVNAYTYDARNWLTSATYPDGRTEQFEYDPVGNRTKRTDSVHGVSTYSYGAGNRLLSDSNGTYSYDNAGRLIAQTLNGQSRSYEYSFRGQMTSLTDTNGTTFTYEFDGDGNRISASVAGCLTARYVYDGPNVVLDLNGSNQVTRAYINGPGIDELIERIDFLNGEQRARYVYHTDGLHSVVAITDAAQTVVKTYSYEAFGKIRAETGSLVDRYTFTGREAIGSSEGLYYLRTRLMNPNTGRFTSEDVIGFAEGPNTYSYVGNNPTGLVDPWGMQMWGPPVNGFPQPCTGCTGNTAVNVPPVPLPPSPPPGPIGGNICGTCVGNNAAPPFPPPCI
jgi:RHS repeat-associated protein